ncbi:hypothetical protein DL98DRAFT_565731 [Cadophora sp. DSE1049]|nr:hypothetical protein DL98DRAFT_565731 [Cadophora sp. DSE1049]
MAQHDEHPEVQAFHAFLRKNISYAVVDPNSASARRGFQSIKAIREYFEQNGSTRLRELLLGVWYPDEPLVDPDDILQNYIAVFCILVELGKGTFVEHFSSRDLSDLRLPFDPGQSPQTHFPTITDDPNFFRAFCDMQWKYCAPEFKCPMMNIHFEDQRILPIVSKELIAGGGSALLYRIRLHSLYNRLDPRKPTYTAPDAAVYYKNEVNAFRRLKRSQTSSLIGFYGSFIQGHTFNIILEYADQGTLEHYFSDTSPPSRGVDIINFWESLFRAIWGLKCIHEVDGRGASEGPQILHGFHQDIKPANFLVCSNGDSSRYNWQFKLADLGLSHFNKITEGLGIAIANDTQGTRTYGAPECYRGDDYTDRGNIKIEQRVDIWSLGCIFSEAAIWIAHGYNGLEDYRKSRRLATNHIDGFRENDCFHDGQNVLPTVHGWHFEAHPVLRQADFITKAVLSVVEQDMLVVAEYRATAHQLWGKAVTILQRAKDQLDQLNLAHSSDISSGDASIRSPRQISPESPPVASGSKFKSGAVVIQATQGGGRSPPRQPPELPPSGSPPSRHQSTMQESRIYQQGSSTHGEPSSHYSQIVPGGRRDYSPDRLPSRKSTRTTQRSTSADFDGNTWQRSKVSFSNPENHYNNPQQSPGLVENPEQDEGIPKLQQQRPATTPSRSNKGSRQGSNHIQGEDDEDEMRHRGGAFGGSYHHANLQFRERKETQSSTATTTTEEDSLTPAPTPKTPKPMPKTKRTAPSKKSSKAKSKEPKPEMPYLSVAKASVWKAQCQAQTTLGFGSSKIRLGPDPDPLPYGYLLERLERRDHAFLIDNSRSMKVHWADVTMLVGILAYMVKPFDSNGLEMMYTISSSKSITSKHSSKLVASLEKTKPAGMSDISIRLNSILEQYKSKIHEVYGAGSRVTAKARNDVRPLTLYVLTDGVWHPKCDAETPIKNLVRTLLELKAEVSPKQVGVQFIYFGNNAIGKARVKKLDDKIIIEGSDTQLDIVDTEPSNGNVWKMLLGAIDPYFDDSEDDDCSSTSAEDKIIDGPVPAATGSVIENRSQPGLPPSQTTNLENRYHGGTQANTGRPPVGPMTKSMLLEPPAHRRLSIKDEREPQDTSPVREVPLTDTSALIGNAGIKNMVSGADSTERRKNLPTESAPLIPESVRDTNAGVNVLISDSNTRDEDESSSITKVKTVPRPSIEKQLVVMTSLSDSTREQLSNSGPKDMEKLEQGSLLGNEVTASKNDAENGLSSNPSEIEGGTTPASHHNTVVQSKSSTSSSSSEQNREQLIGHLLASNSELKPLLRGAIEVLGKIRFTESLQNLLKEYYSELYKSAAARSEKGLLYFLYDYHSRQRLSQHIADRIAPEIEARGTQPSDRVVSWRENMENLVVRGPVRKTRDSLQEESFAIQGNRSVQTQEAGDERTSGPESSAEMETFLLTCGDGMPFSNLLTSLRLSNLPPELESLGRILTSIPKEKKTSLGKIGIGGPSHLAGVRCRTVTCGYTGDARDATVLRDLVQGKPPCTRSFHLCAQLKTHETCNNSLLSRFTQAVGFGNAQVTAHTGTRSEIESTSDIGLQRLDEVHSPDQSESITTADQTTSNNQDNQAVINIETINSLFVLLGVDVGQRCLRLPQINVSNGKDDKYFFDQLWHQHKRQRGWRHWFSVYRFVGCDFVQFCKIGPNMIMLQDRDKLPEDVLYNYTPRVPHAAIPPISLHEFQVRLFEACRESCIFKGLHKCRIPAEGCAALNRIPKRISAFEAEVSSYEHAWGLLAQYTTSAFLVLIYLLLSLASLFGFWGWWQRRHPDDLQNASTPLVVFVTLLGTWLASYTYLESRAATEMRKKD